MGWEESLEEVRRRLAPPPAVQAVLWEEEDWRGELLRRLERLPPREVSLPEVPLQLGWRERIRAHKPVLNVFLLLLVLLLLFSPLPAWLYWPLSIFLLFLLVFSFLL